MPIAALVSVIGPGGVAACGTKATNRFERVKLGAARSRGHACAKPLQLLVKLALHALRCNKHENKNGKEGDHKSGECNASFNKHEHTHTQTHANTNTNTNTRTHTQTQTQTHTHTHANTNTNTHAHTHAHANT